MSGITYFCTDKHGHTYTRYSAGHREPRYITAAIKRRPNFTGPVSKAFISYSSFPGGPLSGSEWHGYEIEVVPVRAYNHRRKEEPVGALEVAAAQMPQAGADPIVAKQRDVLPFWEAVNAELKAMGEEEVLWGDIRSLAELFTDPVEAARHERRVRIHDHHREVERADAQQGRREVE